MENSKCAIANPVLLIRKELDNWAILFSIRTQISQFALIRSASLFSSASTANTRLRIS